MFERERGFARCFIVISALKMMKQGPRRLGFTLFIFGLDAQELQVARRVLAVAKGFCLSAAQRLEAQLNSKIEKTSSSLQLFNPCTRAALQRYEPQYAVARTVPRKRTTVSELSIPPSVLQAR